MKEERMQSRKQDEESQKAGVNDSEKYLIVKVREKKEDLEKTLWFNYFKII